MRLSYFWPWSVIAGQRAKIDRMMVDITEWQKKSENLEKSVVTYSKRIVGLSRELNAVEARAVEIEDRFVTAKDARAGDYMIGGYSEKKWGEEFELAVGREVIRSGQLVVFPVPKDQQSNPAHKHMFRLNVQRTKR